MSKLAAALFWRKLDQPGYDNFRNDVSADAAFRTRSAHVLRATRWWEAGPTGPGSLKENESC
jgi:hypothetical protein